MNKLSSPRLHKASNRCPLPAMCLRDKMHGVRWEKKQQENNKPNSILFALLSLLPRPLPQCHTCLSLPQCAR